MARGSNWRRPAEERFWEKVDRGQTCWTWTAGLNRDGYGSFWDGTRNVKAHRFSYELLVGPIPDGLQIDHLCRNRACVNPEHLEPVTNRVNAQRGQAGWHKRDKMADLTHCPKGHEYVPENIRQRTKYGRLVRTCRTCERESGARRVTCPRCGKAMRKDHRARHLRRCHAIEQGVASAPILDPAPASEVRDDEGGA